MYCVGRTYVLQNVFLETQNQNVFTERLANVKSVNFKICCRDNVQSIASSTLTLTTELVAFCPVQSAIKSP